MIKKININSQETRVTWIALLNKEGIKHEDNVEEVFGLFENDNLIATAARYQNVIKCVAVDSDYQGSASFNEIISYLMNQNTSHGYFKHYVYTKPESQKAFEYLGFQAIENVDNKLVFMEKAITGFNSFIKKLEAEQVDKENIAAIVMNANPFSLGHQYLVEKAASENDFVYVFVLSEEMSVFTTSIRTELVKAGLSHLDNVKVLSTENYMVSNATFPSYFLKEDDDTTAIQARLDAKIFANHIAKALKISKRLVGEEPYSRSTNLYNEAMKIEFADKLDLEVIPRLANNEDIISATKIRNFLIADDLNSVKKYVPKTTYDFLVSEAGKAVIMALKESNHEHP
ncbi:MAG: [citrate (pro-3S)-lyase] ligase [Erysipelothrix sp.]|nr:[citrate (pro-3S)-lyase] ligase [Erysipelothrix sp.]